MFIMFMGKGIYVNSICHIARYLAHILVINIWSRISTSTGLLLSFAPWSLHIQSFPYLLCQPVFLKHCFDFVIHLFRKLAMVLPLCKFFTLAFKASHSLTCNLLFQLYFLSFFYINYFILGSLTSYCCSNMTNFSTKFLGHCLSLEHSSNFTPLLKPYLQYYLRVSWGLPRLPQVNYFFPLLPFCTFLSYIFHILFSTSYLFCPFY